MKRIALLFAVLFLHSGLAAQTENTFQLPLFTEGLSTRYSANVIPDSALTEALNVVLDEDLPGVPVARNGYSKYNPTAIATYSIRGLWPYDASDGTKYLVVQTSASFYKSPGDSTWTKIQTDNMSLTRDFDCTQALGYLWCINGESVFRWNGTSTATIAAVPLGTMIDSFRNRIVVAGIAGGQSRIRLSGELDGSDFTVGVGQSTSPANIAVGGVDDGLAITCLMGVYQDVLIIGKRDSLWGLYGFGTNDFSLRELSREVGCLEDRSVREKNGCLYWLSKRGIEKFCGANIERISDPIRNTIDTIIATAGNVRSLTDSSKEDFENGTQYPANTLNTGTWPGTLFPSSTTAIYSSNRSPVNDGGFGFSSNTLVDIDTTTYPGATGFAMLAKSSWTDDFRDNDYETGTVTWTVITGTWVNALGAAGRHGYNWYSGGTSGSPYTNVGITMQNIASTGTWSFLYFYVNGNTGNHICSPAPVGYECISYRFIDYGADIYYRLQLTSEPSQYLKLFKKDGTTEVLISSTPTGTIDLLQNTPYAFSIVRTAAGGFAVYVNGVIKLTGNDTTYSAASRMARMGMYDGDQIQNYVSSMSFQSYVRYGEMTSPIFDTGYSTPIAGVWNSTYTLPGASTGDTHIAYYVKYGNASNGSDFGNWEATSNSIHVDMPKRYWQYRAIFTTRYSTITPTLYELSLNASSTGTFISQCRNTSPNITAWNLFQCNQTVSDASISYYISTGPVCSEVTLTTKTWTAQGNNTSISVSTAQYYAFKAVFNMDHGTQTAMLHDCTISWKEGANRPPVASSVYRDRYYLSYSSSTDSNAVNDHIIVLDKNDKWTMFDNHNCYSLNLYERKLYCGSANNNGYVYRMDIGTDDDGAAFTTKIKTKAFNFGLPEARKTFQKLYLELEPEPNLIDDINLDIGYSLDRGTVTFSLNSINLGEDPSHLQLGDFPFPAASENSGRYIQLSIQGSGLNQPWRLYGGRLYYNVLRKE